MARILIKNGRVWDGERFLSADILTDGEHIVKIAPAIDDESFTYLYDATGQTVTAGMVDAHVHMRLTRDDPFSIQAEMSCFPFGVTAAADAGRDLGNPSLLDSFMLKNVVFVTAALQSNHLDVAKTEAALHTFASRAVGIKVYFDASSHPVSDITPLAEACVFAKARGLRVMVHCANSPTPMAEILQTLNAGDILTHSFHGGKNTAAEDGFASMKEAQARGVIIDVGMAGYVHTDFAILKAALKCGIVPDLIGTDITKFSAYTRGSRYGMTVCMSIARHLGMKEEDVFRAVTSNPARALGKELEWGALRVGGIADIAVLKECNEGFDMTDAASNRIQSNCGYRCALTVSDGQIVYRD